MAGSFKKRWANWREARRERSKARDGPKTHGNIASTATPTIPSTASTVSRSCATSLTPPIKQSLEVQRSEQGSGDYRPITPSGTTTEHVTPTTASEDHNHAQHSNIGTRATGHHQPAATSQTPNPAPSIEPRAEVKAIESTEQPTASLSTSQRLWDAAYNSLAEDKDTAKLVGAYMGILDKVLGNRTHEPAVDVSTTLKDPSQRQAHMKKLVEAGQAKISTLSKITQGVGDVVQFVLSAKAMIDLAIQNIPQAALPWAGACIGLQILLNPIQAIESNLAGITHVISRMDWYCALTEHILSRRNIVVGNESFESVQLLLENKVVELYKALLLYQMKSICSFYRHQVWVFLRGLANIDDWDTDLKSVTNAEATLQTDLSQFNSQHTKSLLGKLAEEAEKRKALLGDIHQTLQDGIAVQRETHQAVRDGNTLRKEIHKDDKDTQCLHDLHITDPRDDKKRIEETKGGLLQDAYHWILDNSEFQQWRNSPDSHLLWIKGHPGKGKTMLLCGIIDELQRSTLETSLLSFFFCQATDSRINNATAVLRGLIYLLLDQQPSLISHVRKKYDHAGKTLFEDANGWVSLSEIFINILQDPSLGRAYLIIDALDECIYDLPRLLKLIVELSSTFPHAKWIVSSRNWQNIEESLDASKQKVLISLESNEGSIASAVSTYIRHKVSGLAQQKEYDNETRDAVQQYLASNANDTFLWVALVCQQLSEIPKWDTPIPELETFPPGLGSLYRRMIGQVLTSKHNDLCKQILAVVSVTYRPLTVQELASFVEMRKGIRPNDFKFLVGVIGLCGSFLVLRESTIYFVHQSAKNFLLEDALDEIFPSRMEAVHYSLFLRSLHTMSGTLRRDLYGLTTPGFPIENVNPPDPDPLVAARYACVYWVDHLYDSQSSDNTKHPDVFQDAGIIDDFLRQHYLHWLEALSLCRSMWQGILSIMKLESILRQKSITSQLLSLVSDMRRFVLYCRWVVENYPLQVYASALVFSPARSITRNQFKTEEQRWIATGPIVEDNWNACRQTLESDSGRVNSVTFSPDSKLMASGSSDGTVKIWDAATGICTHTLKGHRYSVVSVAFSPDSKLVVSGSSGNTIKIWDAATGTCRQTIKEYSNLYSVVFLQDSTLVASGSRDSTIKIWDVATGTCTQTLEGHSYSVNSVAFSPLSKLIASGSSDRTVKIWDAVTGICTQTLEGHSLSVTSVAFSPDSKLIASGSNNSAVKIWDVARGTCTQTLEGHSYSVNSVAFSPDSKLVASGSSDGTVEIWDASTGTCTHLLKGHSDLVSSVMFLQDAELVASGSWDTTIKIWDVATGTYIQTLEGHDESVWSVAFSPDLKLVISGSGDETVKIWDTATGACRQTLKGHVDSVWSVAFSSDSKFIVSGSRDHMVKIWDVATGTCIQTLQGHKDSVSSVMFSPNSTLVASRTLDNTIKIWDAATGKCMQTFERENHYVRSVALSPDSKLIASGSSDRTVKIWDAATGTCMQTLKGHSGHVHPVAFSLDSKLLASGSDDKTVKIWDAATGACRQTLEGHSVCVSWVAFSCDSKLVASWSGDTVKIWDAATGTCMQTLERHASELDFSTIFASQSGDAKKLFQQDYSIGSDHIWIMKGSENWLWLPPGYRPECSAVATSKIVIGCKLGRVLIMTLRADT